ncbi:MAG: AMP-binding protein [Candidatus Hodarchaeales archaeon]|jgi:long-chain acyl-CoA synthetase
MTYADKPWLKSYFVGPFKLKKTMAPYPSISVYKFLEDAANDYPENIATVYLDHELTYEELKLKVDKLATALADLGVQKGDKVATILPSCPQFIIADYAIMRLGATHVPLSILHKAPEILHELDVSGAETVICSYRRLQHIDSIKDQTKAKLRTIIYTPVAIFPDYSLPEVQDVPGAHRLDLLIENYEAMPPEVEIDPNKDLALLPFTGGTTGVPKATMLTHRNITTNIVQSFHWMMEPLSSGIKGKAAVVICVPMFHQYGHWVLHAAVSWGLKMFIVDPRDIGQIATIIKENRPFGTFAVPTHYTWVLKSQDIKKIPSFFYSGAAALPPDLAKAFEKKVGVPMGEGYGMTEATAASHINISSISKVTGFMAKVKRSIGVPLPDTEVKILDQDTGEEVPPGEAGELWIRGPQVMQGYWPTPGSGLQADGWLATGDIGKMDEDGYFHIVDRIKDMVNVSGMKVYSRLVDDVLYEHPAVSEAGIIGVPDPERPGSERIKAFIALKSEHEGEVTAEDIISHCKENLPPYAVPKGIEFRDSLPLTLVMKVDKKKLREENAGRL